MSTTSKPPLCVVCIAVLLGGCEFVQAPRELAEVSKRVTENAARKVEEVVVEADQLALPQDVANRPWNVGVVPQFSTPRPVQLGRLLPEKCQIWGGAISQSSGRAILTYMDKGHRDIRDTVAIVCDVHEGRALAQFRVEEFLAPFCIHPDGRTAIFCRQDGVRSGRETLYIAGGAIGSSIAELRTWRPLVDPAAATIRPYEEEWEITWASFVGPQRIVTLNNAGKLHVWKFPDLNRLAVFPGVKGTPCLTPDGSKVAFLTDDMVALLDPSVPEITHAHRVGELPEEPLPSFHPTGRLLAIAGKGKAIFLRLDNLKQWECMIDRLSTGQGMDLMPDLAWFDSFLYTNRQLFAMDSPIPVWQINGTRWEKPDSRFLWAVVCGKNSFRSKKHDIVLRAFQLPIGSIAKEIEEIYRTTEVIAVRTGDPVRIDVAGIPPEKQEEVRAALKKRLADEGYRPSKQAKVTLRASLEPARRTTVTYSKSWCGKEKRKYSYDIRRAHMEFVKDKRTLWSTTAYEIPPSSIAKRKLPKTEFVSDWGVPDYSLFVERNLPAYLRGDRSGSVLGITHLFSAGMK